MKKSIAALSATVLGLGGAVAGGALSASAADPIAPCASATDHTVEATSAVDSHWYMACQPKYGMGKAEFSVTSNEAFPAGFNLNNSTETGTSNLDDSAQYFSALTPTSSHTGIFTLSTPATLDPKTQQYHGWAAFPVTSVEQYTGTLPAECMLQGVSYDHVYRVNYGAATTTFKQKVNGTAWNFAVTLHPQPLILGLNFSPAGTGLDPARPLCAVQGSTAYFGAQQDSGDWGHIASSFATRNATETLDPLTGFPQDVGSFARLANATTTPTASADAQLAETGVSPVPAGIAAASLLAIAVGFFAIGRRRRSAARKH
ncbi:MAG: hypothetical protein JWQ12_23 [Glaciihabitans sp.]|nr:hypothetical protein [Glaciihabitans sp.]